MLVKRSTWCRRIYVDFNVSFMHGRAVKPRKAAVREARTWMHTKWLLAPV